MYWTDHFCGISLRNTWKTDLAPYGVVDAPSFGARSEYPRQGDGLLPNEPTWYLWWNQTQLLLQADFICQALKPT